MALTTRDANGAERPLVQDAVAVGVGVSQTGKEFEVVGNLVSRASSEAGGTAMAIATEGDVHGSIWTNRAYDPANPGSGWKRTINLVNGNVGIGGSKDVVARLPAERLVVEGNIMVTGDVRLAGADCAEEFNVEAPELVDPGTVLVIVDEELLHPCGRAYDTRVAGVVSGGGSRQPGIILGRQTPHDRRIPVALTGTVYCKVDADLAPVGIGDLLTTSSTPGHAMKASDQNRAPGAVLGKALRAITTGQGLIPILVALH